MPHCPTPCTVPSHAKVAHPSPISRPCSLLLCQSQDPVHKWADLQRALLLEGQSVWCCKGCIDIINEDKNATYKEIRDKVEAAAGPLPEVTDVAGAAGEPAADQLPPSPAPTNLLQNAPAVERGAVQHEVGPELDRASSAGGLEGKMLRLQAEMKAMKDEPATMSVKICSPCSLL